jgi:anti-anti-sigma factor
MQIGERRSGVLVLAPGARGLRELGELERLVVADRRGRERLVMDLAGVEYISSAGLRVLLMAAKRLKGPAAGLVLCGLGPSVRTVLELAGFLPLFAVEAGREQAVARIGGPATA